MRDIKDTKEFKSFVKFVLEDISRNEVSDKDVEIFVNGGRFYVKQHVDYNYDIVGTFKLVKDGNIIEDD